PHHRPQSRPIRDGGMFDELIIGQRARHPRRIGQIARYLAQPHAQVGDARGAGEDRRAEFAGGTAEIGEGVEQEQVVAAALRQPEHRRILRGHPIHATTLSAARSRHAAAAPAECLVADLLAAGTRRPRAVSMTRGRLLQFLSGSAQPCRNSPAETPFTKASHSPGVNASTGPIPLSLVSRTATLPSPRNATSTQFPSGPLYELLRHTAPVTSTSTALAPLLRRKRDI